uniref:C3H1-type domain-containing protein n=1 Tax=Cyprinus carpio TaxID=7962 RepID=A0A8C2AD43_CYPCA
MAEYLVNCSFYFKIGACRHGDRCSRLHNKPTFSQTILIQNIYRNPQNSAQTADASRCAVSDVEMQEHYDEFFEVKNYAWKCVTVYFVLLSEQFRREEDAEKAVLDLNNRWFNGQPMHAELSPVTDFREACCRQYEMGSCTRGGFCNFMHLKPISRELRRELYGRRRKRYRKPSSPKVKCFTLMFLQKYKIKNVGHFPTSDRRANDSRPRSSQSGCAPTHGHFPNK